MKIISGKLKGREIKNKYIEGTRPTMDRVKESIFSTIQDYIKDSICLDLFSGTGNLGIEAISNGANKCYFIDNNIKCINDIKETIEKFNIKDESIILKKDYKEALKYFSESNIKFNLIFLDPPYKNKIINEIIEYIYNNDLLEKKGLIICEYESDELDIENIKFELKKHKKYGSKKVSIFISNV